MNQPVIGEAHQISREGAVLATNRLIRNTYLLLTITLAFSAATAGIAMFLNMPPINFLLVIGLYFFFLFMVSKNHNSAWGLFWVFALTGFVGLSLGPILSFYMSALSNGPQLVATAFGGTAAIFLGLTGYALTTRKDFNFLGGFVFAGCLVAFLAGMVAMFLQLPLMHLGVSAAFILVASALILFETSRMVHRPEETNYILATVSLYIAIYQLFTSLLHILGAVAGNSD